MRRIIPIALAALVAAPALAQGTSDEAWQGESWLSRWDRDGDGFIAEQEFGDGLSADGVFGEWDTDGDGVLDENEFSGAWFSQYDTNEDGMLDPAEISPEPTPREESGMIGDGMVEDDG